MFDLGFYYNVEGEKLSIVGINRRPNIYTSPFHSLNFNFSCYTSLKEKLKITLTVKNLLNQKIELFAKSYGIDDQVYNSFHPGRALGFKISYLLND